MSSNLEIPDRTRLGRSDLTGSTSSSLTQFPGAEYTLPSPTAASVAPELKLSKTTRLMSLMRRKKTIQPHGTIELAEVQGGHEHYSQPAGIDEHYSRFSGASLMPSDSISRSRTPVSKQAATPDDDSEEHVPIIAIREQLKAVDNARREVLSTSPVIVEISTNNMTHDDALMADGLRNQIARIFGRDIASIYLIIEKPKAMIFGAAKECFFTKVTAVEGALMRDDRRVAELQRVLSENLQIQQGNGITQFIYVSQENLAVGSRTTSLQIDCQIASSRYRQPSLLPQREEFYGHERGAYTKSRFSHESLMDFHPKPQRFYGTSGSSSEMMREMPSPYFDEGAFTRTARRETIQRRSVTEHDANSSAYGNDHIICMSPVEEIPCKGRSSRVFTTNIESSAPADNEIVDENTQKGKQNSCDPAPKKRTSDTCEEDRNNARVDQEATDADLSHTPQIGSSHTRNIPRATHGRELSEESHTPSEQVFAKYMELSMACPESGPAPRSRPATSKGPQNNENILKLFRRPRAKTFGTARDEPASPLANMMPTPPPQAVLSGRSRSDSVAPRVIQKLKIGKRNSGDVEPRTPTSVTVTVPDIADNDGTEELNVDRALYEGN